MSKIKEKVVDLIMWSGGLDSTFLLYKKLMDNKKSSIFTHAHFVELRTNVGRFKAEKYAVDSMKPYFQRYPLFDFSSSIIDYQNLLIIRPDVIPLLFMASLVGRGIRAEQVRVYFGWIDNESTEQNYKGENPLAYKIRDLWSIHSRQTILYHELFAPLLDLKIDKGYIIKECPDELINLTWSCRTPKLDGYTPCGKCITCKELNEAKK